MSASAAPLATFPTSTLGCWPICEHPENHSLSEGRPSSNRVQLILTGICFPFEQKDSLGQIGKQQLSFGADQHNSEAITWNGSLSAPEIIFRLNLELGSEIGRWSFSQSCVFALTCPDKTLLTCGRDVFSQWVHWMFSHGSGIFVFVLLWPIYSREGQAQHFCTTSAAALNVTSRVLKGSCFLVLTPAQLLCSNLPKTSCCSRVKKETGAGFNQPWRLCRPQHATRTASALSDTDYFCNLMVFCSFNCKGQWFFFCLRIFHNHAAMNHVSCKLAIAVFSIL